MIGSVFIVGCGRSGSTLLDRLVGSHPSAIAAGELRHLPKNIALDSRCSCGAKISACFFWRPVIDAVGSRLGWDLWRNPYALDLGYIQAAVEIDRRRQTRLYAARRMIAMRWFDVALRCGADVRRAGVLAAFRHAIENSVMLHDELRSHSACQIVVDSTKGFRWSIGQYLMDPSTSRVLLLTRDGRGVMASMMRSGRPRQQAVRQWVEYYERALPWVERHVAPQHVLQVRYEDLAGDTESTLARIFDFLSVPYADAKTRAQTPPPHIVNGNPMRHGDVGHVRVDERWRSDLSAADLACFDREAATMAKRLGYAMAASGL